MKRVKLLEFWFDHLDYMADTFRQCLPRWALKVMLAIPVGVKPILKYSMSIWTGASPSASTSLQIEHTDVMSAEV